MKQYKKDFPFFQNKNLIYFDSAATTPKLASVIAALHDFYLNKTAPIHRGVYKQAEETTALYENTRVVVADFFHARLPSEIAFTSGTTESLNAIAFGFVQHQLQPGDEIIISELEHNANVLPWQEVAKRTGALLRYIPLLSSGDLDYDFFESMLNKKVKFVSVTHCSNSLGTLVTIDRIIKKSHEIGALVCIDAAQIAGHIPINVQENDADFFVCSAHKMYAPYGVGILYAKQELHDQFSPFRFGGGIISDISYHDASFLPFPTRLEAGTPAIPEVIALSEGVRYLKNNMSEIQKQEQSVFAYLEEQVSSVPGVIILGTAKKVHTLSFLLKQYHAHDVATYLDTHDIAVRAGTHCAHLVAKKWNYAASIRVSIGMYNTKGDVDRLIHALSKI
jgi:cysteine desulfurase / selenocysteine lyase